MLVQLEIPCRCGTKYDLVMPKAEDMATLDSFKVNGSAVLQRWRALQSAIGFTNAA